MVVHQLRLYSAAITVRLGLKPAATRRRFYPTVQRKEHQFVVFTRTNREDELHSEHSNTSWRRQSDYQPSSPPPTHTQNIWQSELLNLPKIRTTIELEHMKKSRRKKRKGIQVMLIIIVVSVCKQLKRSNEEEQEQGRQEGDVKRKQ